MENYCRKTDVISFAFSQTPIFVSLSNCVVETLPSNSDSCNSISFSEKGSPNLLCFGSQEEISPLISSFLKDSLMKIEMENAEKTKKVIEQDEFQDWLSSEMKESLLFNCNWSKTNFSILESKFRSELEVSLEEASKSGEDYFEDIIHKELENLLRCFLLDFFNDELPKRPKVLYTFSKSPSSAFVELSQKSSLVIPFFNLGTELGFDLHEFYEGTRNTCLSNYGIWKSFRAGNKYAPPLEMCLYPETNVVLPFFEVGNSNTESKFVGLPKKKIISLYSASVDEPKNLSKRMRDCSGDLNFFKGVEILPFSHEFSEIKMESRIDSLSTGLTLTSLNHYKASLLEENLKENLTKDEIKEYEERIKCICEAFLFD